MFISQWMDFHSVYLLFSLNQHPLKFLADNLALGSFLQFFKTFSWVSSAFRASISLCSKLYSHRPQTHTIPAS